MMTILKKLWKNEKTLWNGPYKIPYQFGLLFAIALVLTVLGAGASITIGTSLIIAACVAVVGVVVGYSACWVCRWRNLKKVLVGIAGFAVVFGIGLGIANYNAKSAWGDHKAKLELAGEKFARSSFIPPEIPNDQNFVMTPLLLPIFNYAHGPKGTVWFDTNGITRVQELKANVETKTSKWGTKSSGGNIEKGTYFDFEVVRDFYRGNTNYTQPTVSGTAAEDIIVALSKFDAEYNELKTAAVTRPLSRWPIHYTNDNNSSWEILLPHLANVKGLTILCQQKAIAFVGAGQGINALDSVNVALRMSDSLKNEPFLISHLVRIASLQLSATAIREGLHRHVWNDSQLAELQKTLASIDLLAEFKEAMRAERAWGVVGMEEMMNRKMSIDVLGYFESNADVNKNRRTKGMLFKVAQYSSCIFYQNMMCLSTWEQIIIDNAVDVKQHRINIDIDTIMTKKLSGIKKNPFNFIAGMLVPAVTHCYMKAGRGQNIVDCEMVAIAIERYQLKNGKLPNTLGELAPTFIDKIPTDVIDGKPLRYCQLSNGGYVLYSIGYNKVDDGGVTGFNEKGSPDYKKGDWAYPMPMK